MEDSRFVILFLRDVLARWAVFLRALRSRAWDAGPQREAFCRALPTENHFGVWTEF